MRFSEQQILTPESVAQYFALGTASVHRMWNHPTVDLVIDPTEGGFALLVATDEEVARATKWRRIRCDRASNATGESVARVRLDDPDGAFESYSLLVRVAALIASGHPLADSVDSAMATLESISARRASFAYTEMIGLYGELLVLSALADFEGWPAAVESWIAGEASRAEEHDFRLGPVDLEVKTTSSERREHFIASVTQLEPLPGRPLYLASVQVTEGAGSGTSLDQLIDQSLNAADSAASELRQKCDDRLARTQFDDLPSLTLRSSIEVLAVQGNFPSITWDTFANRPEIRTALRSLVYQIDVGPIVSAGGSSEIYQWMKAKLA